MEPTIKTIRLLIVDDHQLVRDGIRVMLESKENLFHFDIDEAENGEMAVRQVLKKDFDIVLLDHQMPGMDGTQTLQKLHLYKKDLKVLVLSNYDELSYIRNMMNEGASGYILKNIDPSQLLNAIETVLAGRQYYSNDVAIKLIDSARDPQKAGDSHKGDLTDREFEILKLIAKGMTNSKIAEQLFISKRTVDTHRQNLLKKLQVQNTAGLLRAAHELNLL